jgi:hypothetical protein
MNKKGNSVLIILFVSLVVIGGGLFIADKFNLTGLVIGDGKNVIEKTSEIEVWADALIEFNEENNQLLLKLDDGTFLENQEIEFYENGILVSTEITDSEGVTLPFNPNEASPGINSEIKFSGNPSLYLNPSELKFDYEEIQEEKIFLIEENETLINENAMLINLNDYSCKDFEEKILWSSGYTNKQSGSTNYETWIPKYNCSEIGKENCIITDIELDSRLISVDNPDGDSEGIGYIQSSEINNCNIPQSGEYLQYLVYDKTYGEEVKREKYCGNKKGSECEVEVVESLGELKSCYGIKAYGSQYLLMDVFSIKYSLCKGVKNG